MYMTPAQGVHVHLMHERGVLVGTVRAPALLMIGCSLLALTGSIWVERYGGHVLAD
jgi:hypothetical protein